MSDRELKILMIDDDEQILFALRAVFQFQGWESVSAKDVPSGLELFRSEHPDLVLIDYHLPRVNGVKGVRMIRELDGEVPIIVFTIDESQEVADQFIEAGASDFALKPIKVPDIISRIRLHIRLIDSNRRLKDKKEERAPVATAKGIGLTTLELIEGALQGSDEFLTVEAISQRTGLAYQTTYRYLQHMVSQDRVEVSQSYGKVGRPKQKYRLKS
ncbi:response regulator [Pseudoflavonifractor phocaeensis]|uniref:response regulator n=1 Tax=Pseudoflavonifractor phocaeensis TaxID=1870988 RepID=UPI001F1E8484|nr:response regulator [Pseudoflavonifractor phocaeensis]MCF2596481.1 response regulator [Pseudoflavonifractor phocaeensis]